MTRLYKYFCNSHPRKGGGLIDCLYQSKHVFCLKFIFLEAFPMLDPNCYFCLHLGAAVDYKDGFVGCMRALMVNGVVMDMRGKVERGEVTYGVSTGMT